MKNYLVVGGTSGIGQSIVRNLANLKHDVYVISRKGDNQSTLPNIHHLAADVVADEIDVSALPDAIDGVVYCPGSINLKPFRSLKIADFQNEFEVNFLGAVKVLQAVQKKLKKSQSPSVVLFSTVAVQQGMAFHASVAAAKGAVEGLTRSLAAEWAPRIRVNCIAPSLTDTPLAERLLSTPEKKESAGNRHPLKRVGTADEIAQAACFLLSENSSWMTGQVLGIDGGLSALKV